MRETVKLKMLKMFVVVVVFFYMKMKYLRKIEQR